MSNDKNRKFASRLLESVLEAEEMIAEVRISLDVECDRLNKERKKKGLKHIDSSRVEETAKKAVDKIRDELAATIGKSFRDAYYPREDKE